MSLYTLRDLRRRGGGPEFLKTGRRTLYRTKGVIEWADDQLRTSTTTSTSRVGG